MSTQPMVSAIEALMDRVGDQEQRIRAHPLFHQLVREVAVAEWISPPGERYRRMNSPTYGYWMHRGIVQGRRDFRRRARLFANLIARDVVEWYERSPGDATACAYVAARDNVRGRLR